MYMYVLCMEFIRVLGTWDLVHEVLEVQFRVQGLGFRL